EEGGSELRSPAWADLLAKVTAHVHLVRPDRPAPPTILDWIERGQQAPNAERRYWVLDPVDGTKGFLRKEQYAIALALVEKGKILLGVLACPNLPAALREAGKSPAGGLGQIYAAARGGGAERIELGPQDVLGPRTHIRVSGVADPALARW